MKKNDDVPDEKDPLFSCCTIKIKKTVIRGLTVIFRITGPAKHFFEHAQVENIQAA